MASLRFENVRKSFGSRRVLRDVSFTVAGGEVLAVLGRNGAGKSTLVKIAAGLMRPSRGTVTREGTIGYAGPDVHYAPELTGNEHLAFFATMKRLPLSPTEREVILASVGLEGRGDDPVSAYSSGMRQRLRLAIATLGTPPILILDEPGLALDAQGMQRVAEIVAAQRERGDLVLLATNDPDEARLATREMLLDG